MKPRRRITIAREGWQYLLVVALVSFGALVREVNLLLILAGMLVGPFLLSRSLAKMTLRGLAVRRKLPHGICAGDLLVAQLTVTNTRRRLGSWAVVTEDEIRRVPSGTAGQRGGAAATSSVLFPYLAAGRSEKGVYRGRLARRGRYRLGPLRLSTRFPFGFFRGSVVLPQSETLVVFPRLGRLTRGWLARHRQAFAGTDRRERRPGREGDFYGVRGWQSGDRRRWIHWRASARTGSLVVRQFEQPRNRDVAVLVDLWQPEQPTAEHRENVELAVSFAATVAADLCRKGDSSVYLATSDGQPTLGGGPASAALLNDLMERLALAEADHRDRLPELLGEAIGRIDPGAEVVLVTTRPADLADTARFAALWSDPARRSLARRIRVVDTSSAELGRYFQAE